MISHCEHMHPKHTTLMSTMRGCTQMYILTSFRENFLDLKLGTQFQNTVICTFLERKQILPQYDTKNVLQMHVIKCKKGSRLAITLRICHSLGLSLIKIQFTIGFRPCEPDKVQPAQIHLGSYVKETFCEITFPHGTL